MFLKLIFQNETSHTIDETLFTQLLERLTSLLNVHQSEVELLLTDNATIQSFNKTYRNKDKATDVLSFEWTTPDGQADPTTLGQIIISVERAQEQAKDLNQSLEEELRFLFTHGLLHLLGYDHEDPQDEALMLEKTYAILGRRAPGNPS